MSKKMTMDEIAEMFGGEIPMEAVQFIFVTAPPDMTLREVRNELEEMAERYRAKKFDQLTYRLRSPCSIGAPSDHDTMEAAANEIERLEICLSLQDGMAGRYKSEVARLRTALEVCAADYISPECTMSDAYPLVAAEFRRRMRTAAEALQPIT